MAGSVRELSDRLEIPQLSDLFAAAMPAYAGNWSQLSKDKLKSILVSHNVALPPGDQRKAVYLQLYLKHIVPKRNESAEFSSDEETVADSDATPVEDQETREGMMDVKSLSNSELKEQLLKLGVKPGPILPSTRRVYEKKLVQLMVPEVEQNNAGHQEQYSDSEDEGSPVMSQLEVSDDIGAIYEMHSYSKRNMDTRSSLGHVASYTRENGRRVSLNQDRLTADKNTMTYRTPSNTPNASLFKKMTRPQTDADTTDLPDPISQSQLRISATCRKSIKGAAGRPIQFKYDDLVAKERMWELSKEASAKTGKERLVSVPLQIALFVVVTLFAVLLYSLTGSPENPFVALSESHP